MTANSRRIIRNMDMPIIGKVFGMEDGYVLDFSNRSFADFFQDELDVDIDDPHWSVDGGSKAKRLRRYLRQADRRSALRTLLALWEYHETITVASNYPHVPDAARVAFFGIVARLGGEPPAMSPLDAHHPPSPLDKTTSTALARRLLDISAMEPQPRGYAFEKFLGEVFSASGMEARASFRLVGEQIDGSFELGQDTYLLEARWRDAQVAVETLRSFNAKVEDKARWSRGLIVSQSGFTKAGLHAYGHAKSIICMDGFDLHETLSRGLDFAVVIAAKARRAAETGAPFVGIRDLDLALTRQRID